MNVFLRLYFDIFSLFLLDAGRKRSPDQSGSSTKAPAAKKTKTIDAAFTQDMVERPTTGTKVVAAASTGALVISRKTSATTTSTMPIDDVQ